MGNKAECELIRVSLKCVKSAFTLYIEEIERLVDRIEERENK